MPSSSDQRFGPGTTTLDMWRHRALKAEALVANTEGRIKALEDAVRDLADEAEGYLNAEYPPIDRARYPLVEKRYKRDMEIITEARKLLEKPISET